MSLPTDRQYSAEHEWVQVEDGRARIGVTAYAAESLGDVVFIDLPQIGSTITAGQNCGEIESTKSVSDLYAPVSGEVTEHNAAAVDNPELVNSDPYGEGWLFTVAMTSSPSDLLDADSYQSLTGN